MRWIDCATEAPPDDEEVLIFEAFGAHGDIRLGRYNPAASYSKDCVLPNAERRRRGASMLAELTWFRASLNLP